MRGVSALSVLLIGPAVLAAPARLPSLAPSPAAAAALRSEAQLFARQLLSTVDQVASLYVRPVKRADLIRAALAGLYEGARLPVPADLEARIRRAAPAAKPGPRSPDPDRELADLILRTRVEVADSEFLRGQNPLVICCRALARCLDAHSKVVTAEEQRHTVGLEEECDGLGLILEDYTGPGPLRLRAVLLGGPAQQVGLRPGDEITHLDGRRVDVTSAARLKLLERHDVPDGPPPVDGEQRPPSRPRPVRLTVRRPGTKAVRVAELWRSRFHPETVLGVTRREDNGWDFWLDRRRRVAHVRLATLGRGTAEELRGVLTGLREEGLRGLVLDLRWCPGGFLHEAVETAGLFVGTGTIATVRSPGKEDVVYRAAGEEVFQAVPVVVLVNGETSGGAELIAAALQDHRRAVVAGQRTRGKASVQTPLSLGVPGVGLNITTGTFSRPSGKNLHRFPDSRDSADWGVRPDSRAEFRISADLGRALHDWWEEQTLRPGASRRRLPLDDPSADPQRQAALDVLLGQLARKVRAQGE